MGKNENEKSNMFFKTKKPNYLGFMILSRINFKLILYNAKK